MPGRQRGIGAAIADTLAAQGATVIGTATSWVVDQLKSVDATARRTDRELDDIYHLWRYVGHVVGMSPELNPVCEADHVRIEDLIDERTLVDVREAEAVERHVHAGAAVVQVQRHLGGRLPAAHHEEGGRRTRAQRRVGDARSPAS